MARKGGCEETNFIQSLINPKGDQATRQSKMVTMVTMVTPKNVTILKLAVGYPIELYIILNI